MLFKIYPLFFFLFLSLPGLTQRFNDYFKDETLRIDLIHAGNDSSEEITLKGFKSEPYFSGSLLQLIDPIDYGKYKFEVYESVTGKLIFSYGYSTLFSEYQFTNEAKKHSKSFEECLIMPFPLEKVNIKILCRDRQNLFKPLFSCSFNPLVDSTSVFKKHYEYRNISANTKKSILNKDYHGKLDIVIVPDGYQTKDSIKIYEDALRFRRYLLDCNPYSNYSESIQFWVVSAFSQDSGTDNPTKNIECNTIINTSFNTFGSDRYLMTEDYFHLKDIAAHVPYDQIYILVNTDRYGGGSIYNFYSVCVSDNSKSEYIFTHEFGHGFAGLGDEYFTSEVSTPDIYNLTVEPWEPNLTTLRAFGTKWEDLVEKGVPIPTPDDEKYFTKVGAFEGGGYMTNGVYRPYFDCSMKTISVNNFCPVCRKAIIRMLEIYTRK